MGRRIRHAFRSACGNYLCPKTSKTRSFIFIRWYERILITQQNKLIFYFLACQMNCWIKYTSPRECLIWDVVGQVKFSAKRDITRKSLIFFSSVSNLHTRLFSFLLTLVYFCQRQVDRYPYHLYLPCNHSHVTLPHLLRTLCSNKCQSQQSTKKIIVMRLHKQCHIKYQREISKFATKYHSSWQSLQMCIQSWCNCLTKIFESILWESPSIFG